VKASPACISLIKSFESLRLVAYLCPAGVWTIGWGHTSCVVEGMDVDEETAELYLAGDVSYVERQLTKLLQACPAVTQGEWDALVSLCFNLAGGPAALPKKAPHLWQYLTAGDVPKAAHEFLDMDHALVNGVQTELAGLKRRRQAEAAMFLGVAS